MLSRCRATIGVISVVLGCSETVAGQAPSSGPARRDTISVRVLTPDSVPASGAEVFVTDVETRRTVQAQQRTAGDFQAVVDEGFGTYVVVGRAPLFQSTRTRVVREGAAVAPLTLVLSPPPVLPKVQVSAKVREAPSTGKPMEAVAATGGRGRNTVPTELQESLLEAAGAIPGVEVLSRGGRDAFSVLGQGPESNRLTLNGLSVTALRMPRDAGAMIEVATGSSDPSRGGFSGGELAISSREPSDVTRRFGRVSIDMPIAAQSALATTYGRRVQASGTLDGSVGARWRQATAGQVGVAPQQLPSALRSTGLQGATLTAGTRQALAEAAERAGLPLGSGTGIWNPSFALSSQWSRPHARRPIDLMVAASGEQQDAVGAGWTVVPMAVGRRRAGAVTAQGGTSWAWGGAWLHELRTGIHASGDAYQPRFDRPTAIITTQARSANVDDAAITVKAGGGSRMPSTTQYGAQLIDKWTWYSSNSTHRVGAVLDVEHLTALTGSGRDRGTFTYPSVEAFAENTPSGFTRSSFPGRSARQLALGASLTDQVRIHDALQIQFGGRLDLFAVRSPTLAVPLGLADDRSRISGADFSPRLGVTGRLFSGRQATRIQLVGGRYVSRWSGVGLDLLARPATAATLLQCVGGVTGPIWDASAFPETACDEAAAGRTPLPVQIALSDRLRPPAAWRGSVALSRQVGPLALSTTAVVSRSSRALVPEDANLRQTPSFFLADEGNRPVFTPSNTISEAGLMSLATSREVAGLGPTFRLVNRGRSDATELHVSAGPARPGGLNYWSATYVWGRSYASHLGVFSPTAGDPRVATWAPSDFDVRHRVVVQGGRQIGAGLIASGILNVRSGLPFTPLVDSDVNGDGYSNDVAFVPASGSTADAVILRELEGLAGGCLRAQRGRIAAVNSCRGPWTAQATAQLASTMGAGWLPRHTTVAIQFVNLPALLDLALNGASPKGWGRSGAPDTKLLTVTGYNPAGSRFGYHVNPGFGRISAAAGWPAPFRVTLEVRSELGPDVVAQQVAQLLSRGRSRAGTRATSAQVATNLRSSVYDPIPGLLELRDSIMLSARQELRIREVQRSTAARLDSVFRPLGEYLARLPVNYDMEDAARRLRNAQAAAYGVMIEQATLVHETLGADQLRLIGGATRMFLDKQSLRLLQRAFR